MTDRSIAWRRSGGDIEEQRPTVPHTWYGWGTVHMRRWQYSPLWGCTQWWLPSVRFYRGGDEYCNNTLLVQVPLLGHVIFWKPWGELRTGRCAECVADE